MATCDKQEENKLKQTVLNVCFNRVRATISRGDRVRGKSEGGQAKERKKKGVAQEGWKEQQRERGGKMGRISRRREQGKKHKPWDSPGYLLNENV